MFTLKQDLGCPRRMTVYAIFDILDRLKSSYDQVMTGDIQAQVSVFGKECLCAFGCEGDDNQLQRRRGKLSDSSQTFRHDKGGRATRPPLSHGTYSSSY